MLNIKIITSQPYCPASDLLVKRVREIINLNYERENISVCIEPCDNEVVYDEWAASEKFGFDRSLLDILYENKKESMDGLYHACDLYTAQSESIRKDLMEIVDKNEAMLAPLLFIDDNIVSEGLCPEPCKINDWIHSSLHHL